MDHQFAVLSSVSDVPPPPARDAFRISGCSLVAYFAHRLSPDADFSELFDSSDLSETNDDRSYASKVRPGAGLIYSSQFESGLLSAALSRVLGISHAPSLKQAVISFGQEYAVSAVPLLLATRRQSGQEAPGIELDEPLTIDALLRFISLLSDPSISDVLAEQSRTHLARGLGVPLSTIERTWAVPGSFAIQLWDLDGTEGRNSDNLYEGVAESRKYAWEISALLSYSTDHFLENGLWLRRSPQNVFSHVRSGMAFFDDHMVFVNPDCCLEMAHLPAWLRGRSQFRLSEYGYDSSSIFVWSAAILRGAICDDLGVRYRAILGELSTRNEVTAGEQSLMARKQIQHSTLLDRAVNFRDKLTEGRNRNLDEQLMQERSTSQTLNNLNRDMEKCASLSLSLLRVREDNEKSRRDSMLAVMGVVLAAVQIPDFVDRMFNWVRGSDWGPLGVSMGLIILPLGLVIQVWRRRPR